MRAPAQPVTIESIFRHPDRALNSPPGDIAFMGGDHNCLFDEEILVNTLLIELIEIYIEGFELEVLKGAGWATASLNPRYIQIEFNLHQMFRGNMLNDFAELMPGFEIYQLLPGGWVRRDPAHPPCYIDAF